MVCVCQLTSHFGLFTYFLVRACQSISYFGLFTYFLVCGCQSTSHFGSKQTGKQTIQTKWPDGKDGENDEERSRRKRDGGGGGGGIHYSHPMENRTWQLSLTACNVTKAGNA